MKPVKFEYTPPGTNRIKSIYKSHDLFDVVFSSCTKLKQLLGTTKDKQLKHERSGIYKVTCKACGHVYIGQSRRQVMVRHKEHIASIKKNKPEKSSVATHAFEKLHLNLDDYQLELIKPVRDNFKLDAWESLYIQKFNNPAELMNIDPSPIFSPLFNLI